MDREAYENAHAQHHATRRDGGTYVPHQHRYDPAESAGCLECGELATMAKLGATIARLLRVPVGPHTERARAISLLYMAEREARRLGLLESDARP